jgi:hypothetical protein
MDYHELARVFTEAGSDFGVPQHDTQRAEEHLVLAYARKGIMPVLWLADKCREIVQRQRQCGAGGGAAVLVIRRARSFGEGRRRFEDSNSVGPDLAHQNPSEYHHRKQQRFARPTHHPK